MIVWALENTVVAAGLAVLVAAVCRLLRTRPAVCHVLWGIVLVRLVAPPLPVWESTWLGAGLGDAVKGVLDEPVRRGAMVRRGAGRHHKVPADGGQEWEWRERSGDAAAERPAKTAWARTKTKTNSWTGPAADASPSTITKTSTREPDARALRWEDLALAAWALGAVFLLGRQARRIARFQRAVDAGAAAPAWLARIVGELAPRLSVAPPRIRLLPSLTTPVVWGMRQATLVWPRAGDATRCARGIVAHELAHLRRRDHWVAWLELAASCVLWWNPLFWLARRELRRHAELACDAWVVQTMPSSRRDYAEALIEVAGGVSAAVAAPAAIGIGDVDRRNFEWRLNLIMRGHTTGRAPSFAFVLAMLGVALVLPTPSDAQDAVLASKPGDTDKALETMIAGAVARKEAARYRRAGQHDRAAEACRRVLEAHPRDGGVVQMLGRSLMRAGEVESAAEVFRRQLELRYEVAQGSYDLACAVARLGQPAAAMKQVRRAVEAGFADVRLLEKDGDLSALRDDPAWIELTRRAERAAGIWDEAEELFEKKEVEKARKAFEELSHLTPGNGIVWHRLAYTSIGTGHFGRAIEACERQLEAEYRVETAHYNIACAKALSGDEDGAFAALGRSIAAGMHVRKHLDEDPDLESLRGDERFARLKARIVDINAMWGPAKQAFRDEDWETAIERFAAIVKLKPTDSAAWTYLGVAALDLGDYPRALAAFESDIRHGGRADRSLYNIACCHALQGRVEPALQWLDRAIDAGWSDKDMLRTDDDLDAVRGHEKFAKLLQRIDDEQVLETFAAVSWEHLRETTASHLEKRPEDGRAWHRLGWADLRLGRYDRAISDFKQQETCGFALGNARYNIACAHALAGRTDEAFGWLEKALDTGGVAIDHIKKDPDLASLHRDERFARLLEAAAAPAKEKTLD